jgi:hypothetical protein
MRKHKPLSVAQLLVLRTAAQRPDRMVLPLPTDLQARGASQTRLLNALLKAALVEELPASNEALNWCKDVSGALLALRNTATGLAERGCPEPLLPEPDSAVPSEPCAAAEPGTRLPLTPAHPRGKLGEVLTAISTEPGAALAELSSSTGWLPHTTRAALTGLRKRGFPVSLIERDGRKAYQLNTAVAG